MRYSRDGLWTPIPFYERVRRAGAGLLVPPFMIALMLGFIEGVLWLVGMVFPLFKANAKPWPEHWISMWLFIISLAWLLVVYELVIINGEYATLDEMVIDRLKQLEDEVMERHLQTHPEP